MYSDYPILKPKLCSRVPFYVTIKGTIDYIAGRYVNSRATLEYKYEDADYCLRSLLDYCQSYIQPEKAKALDDSTGNTGNMKVLKK